METIKHLVSQILDSLSDKIILFDEYGVSQYANNSAQKMFPSLIAGRSTIFDMIDELVLTIESGSPEEEETKNLWQKIQDEDSVTISNVEIDDADTPTSIEISGRWLASKKKKNILITITTIHDEHPSYKTQKTLARVLGHELKRPLNLISTYTYYITKYLTEKNNARVGTYLAKVETKIQLLNKMLNDISTNLKTSIKDIPVKPEKISFRPILSSTIADYKSLYPHRKIQLVIDAKTAKGIKIMADPTRTRQVFTNILDNCIKYSPDDSPITIDILLNSKTVTINFIDQGRGIDAEELNRIFGPYYRVIDASRPSTAGLGLGLSLSRLFMKRQNGDITVISEPGKGSTFSVIFKRAY